MIKRYFVGLCLAFAVAAAPYSATMAAGLPQAQQFAACGTSIPSLLGLEPWWSCLEQKYGTPPDGIPTAGEVRIGELMDIWLIVLVILEDTIKVAAYIAVGFIVWGGIKYVKSQGNPSELQQAQSVLRNAIIGLVITFISVAIVQFIVRGLRQ